MNITAYELGSRFIGIKELPGAADNPFVMAMLQLDNTWPQHDEVPWCSGYVNFIAWLLRLPRSKSLAARSWLSVGRPITRGDEACGFDVVVLADTDTITPGPEDTRAPGHVGFFGSFEGTRVWILGGNQSNSVSVAPFPRTRILGVRRLLDA